MHGLLFNPEDEGSMFFQNISELLLDSSIIQGHINLENACAIHLRISHLCILAKILNNNIIFWFETWSVILGQ
jgi:hypothetical protein